ncbi:Uncharacterized conserved protein, DUF305 family [Nakamurella panacisegetis]|uniref:Uncharacterized conserved protein, DUF305 family n=1 Tax=Nakamurella panacisegetis TaxID=1090615 RepID=A0A1H0LLJ9_9ACTN|nr:DUF305 domain-containing protein [Nakamurella panacisegetis]SDO68760.1 Uncharacterized conserved protein, DUF305 family [Nakamurella panacisegetis]
MNLRTRTCLLAAGAALAVTLTACGAASPGPTAASSTSMSSDTLSSSPMSSGAAEAMPTAPAGPHNQADITFAQEMLVHHRGAITMADLAPTRASSPAVKALAVKIKAAQTPEIEEMSGWLAAWAPSSDMNGMPVTTSSPAAGGMSGMDHAAGTTTAMPGMMSDAQMSQLTSAAGSAFDKLFLQLMITHHQGALTMADTEKSSGQNPAALALAKSIVASQTAEIATMQDLLKGM